MEKLLSYVAHFLSPNESQDKWDQEEESSWCPVPGLRTGVQVVPFSLTPAPSPLLSPRLMAVTLQYGFFPFILVQSAQCPPPPSGEAVHVRCGLCITLRRTQLTLLDRSDSMSLTKSFWSLGLEPLQCCVDVNKNYYKEVEERANDTQHGQDGLLLLLLDLQCPHVLNGDNCGAHDPWSHLTWQPGDIYLK